MAWTDWIDALLPAACAGCDGALEAGCTLCASCEAALPAIAPGACPHCQLHPFAASGCCARRPIDDTLDAGVATCWLEAPVDAWVHAFKYPPRGLRGLRAGPPAALGELARRAAERAPGPAPDALLPVPLHPRRLRARGFNPALSLARAIGRARRLRVWPCALLRERDTPSQTDLDAGARRRNLDAAMRAAHRLPERIWLVDDVITTGATVREAARAARAAGARQVIAIAAARTPLG